MKFSTKKMGVNFFPAKKTKPGGVGGSEGGLVKDHTFAAFFFVHPSLMKRSEKPKCRPRLELKPVTLVRGVQASSSYFENHHQTHHHHHPLHHHHHNHPQNLYIMIITRNIMVTLRGQMENQNLWCGKRSTGILHVSFIASAYIVAIFITHFYIAYTLIAHNIFQ